MEVNDNPNIDVGMEDAALGDELYRRLLQFFLRRADEMRIRQPTPQAEQDDTEVALTHEQALLRERRATARSHSHD